MIFLFSNRCARHHAVCRHLTPRIHRVSAVPRPKPCSGEYQYVRHGHRSRDAATGPVNPRAVPVGGAIVAFKNWLKTCLEIWERGGEAKWVKEE